MVDKTNYENNIDALSKIELIKSQLDEGSSFEQNLLPSIVRILLLKTKVEI